jgi:phenylacetate-CoA ligase
MSAPALALLSRLNESERWDRARLERAQFTRLSALVRHAVATVPYYKDLPRKSWAQMPILSRRDLQDAGKRLLSRRVPARCGRVSTAQSSGSTGEPVKIARTELDGLYWRTLTLRDHLWHRRDLQAKLCAIRPVRADRGAAAAGERRGWGQATDLLGGRGTLATLPLSTDVAAQAEWLARHDPEYLITFPSNALALADHLEANGMRLSRLRELRTVGETLTPALRARAGAMWNVPVTDIYSSEEAGIIALQCPSGSGLYHVMAESVKVEILDEAGAQCPPGAVGRVVVSTLNNFAMPVFRYEIGDYAEAGPLCPCGRGLPTLARILGRRRNMLVLPDGSRRWPLTGLYEFRAIAPIRRAQTVQLDCERLEVRFVADRAITPEEERRLAQAVQRWIGHPFSVAFVRVDAFPSNASGKFEDFVSHVAATGSDERLPRDRR